MSEKPYYEQEYHAPESDIPDPSVGEIFKGLFLYPHHAIFIPHILKDLILSITVK